MQYCNEITVKNALMRHREAEIELDTQNERLQFFTDKLENIGAQNLSWAPGGSGTTDPWTNLIARKEEVLEFIGTESVRVSKERRTIEEAFSKIPFAEHKFVMRLRYIDGFEWPDIQKRLDRAEGTDDDAIKRRMFRDQSEALTYIADAALENKTMFELFYEESAEG